MTDRSNDEIWGLTKRFNCFKSKWNSKNWSSSSFSTNGMFNASQMANTMGVTMRMEKTEKNFRRTFTMTLKHSAKNGIKKNKKNSQSNAAISSMDIGRDPHRAAKALQAQRPVTSAQK